LKRMKAFTLGDHASVFKARLQFRGSGTGRPATGCLPLTGRNRR
jgi:hypothetical protein